jgi:hypothetical protein
LQWSRGADAEGAVGQSGYREEQSAALHVSGDASPCSRRWEPGCARSSPTAGFTDLGSVQRGHDTWIVIAAPFTPPARPMLMKSPLTCCCVSTARVPSRDAAAARLSRGTAAAVECAAAPRGRGAQPGHAEPQLFAHEGYDGSTPAQRVAATGYRYQLVGENIASGPQSAAEAVAGWLASPGHCENIMDPRFSESGVAYAANSSGTPRVYWVQEFAAPRR